LQNWHLSTCKKAHSGAMGIPSWMITRSPNMYFSIHARTAIVFQPGRLQKTGHPTGPLISVRWVWVWP